MKTRARSVLERRFRQWANGKALAAFSAAVLLGLTFSPQQADAQSCALGYGGPVVRVYVHTLNIEGLFSRQLVDTLCLSGLLDKEGRQYVSLMGTAGDGVYSFTDPDTFDTASFTIKPIPDSRSVPLADGRNDLPRVYLDKGTGGVALMVATDMLIQANSFSPGGEKLIFELDSQDHFGSIFGGLHTYGVTMDGNVRGRNPAGTVEVTGVAFLGEGGDVINTIPPSPGDAGPSLSAGTGTLIPLTASGGFSGAVTEDITCGFPDVEFRSCFLQIRNTIALTFAKPGDTFYVPGSFGTAAAVEPGGGMSALVLNKTGVPFATFDVAVATQPRRDTFEVGAIFKVGALSSGINPTAAGPDDKFALRLGGFETTFALNQFVARTVFGHKIYTFDGLIEGSPFKAVIAHLFGKTFAFAAAGRGANLTNPTAFVDVTIGADKGGGEAQVRQIPR